MTKDVEQIVRLKTAVTRETYKDFIPEYVLDEEALLINDRIEKYKQTTLNENGFVNYVVTKWGRVIGFVDANITGFKEHYQKLGYAELFGIFVDSRYQGKGLGKKLFKKAMAGLKVLGSTHMVIYVFEDNRVARDAYERWGGRLDDHTEYREREKQTVVCYVFEL